jgi:hypothetical protein
MESIFIQVVQDLKALAEEHEGTADNELLWALGAPDAESTRIHTNNAWEHRKLAEMYRRMSEKSLTTIIETFWG